MNEEKLIINQTKKGIFLLILGAAVMTIAALVVAFMSNEILIEIPFINLFPGSVIVFRVLMLFGVLFFGFCLVFIIRRSKTKAVFIADENGITDYSSALALGFIHWYDIESISLRVFMSEKYIEVEIKDNEKYLDRLNWLKKVTIKSNVKRGFSICLITLNGTGVKPEAVLPKLITLFNLYTKKEQSQC